MNTELMEALNILEKEKDINREVLLEAIENSLLSACKQQYGKSDNIKVSIDRETCDFHVCAMKNVVEEVEDPALEISLDEARKLDPSLGLGDVAQIELEMMNFGRIAAQKAKSVILQKITEEERSSLLSYYKELEHQIVTGVVQRRMGKNVSVNIGRADAVLNEREQIRGESYRQGDRVKVYIVDVRDLPKGPKILVSRTHPELVRRLFEAEVSEVREGIVEIKGISREAGSRTKITVWSNDPNVDPIGACVGVNGTRVNAVVNELNGEKIDIIPWDENSAILIENALSPARVLVVLADDDEKEATVIVPDHQLSLAIGKEGQNVRLAARLTGFKIDIKSESQARDLLEEIGYYEMEGGVYDDFGEYYNEDGEYSEEEYQEDDEYSEEYAEGYAEDGEASAEGEA
ncbi:MAG: transcription termination factor NusA [Lachnospiraceae bacterium]|nr:transcription termination factor NusA [Lachnospiraceae bacterium]